MRSRLTMPTLVAFVGCSMGPKQTGPLQAGDFEGMVDRTTSGVRPACLPNGWSAPSISSDGTVFVGNENGPMFALRDAERWSSCWQ